MDREAGVGDRPVATARTGSVRARPSAEDIAWVGLWPAVILVLAGVLWLAPPLSDLYPASNYSFFGIWTPQVRPEPLEATRWLIALAVPLLLAGLVCLGSPGRGRERFDLAVIALQVAGLGLVVWAVAAQTNGPFFPAPADYFSPLLLSVPIVVVGTAIGIGLTLLALAPARPLDRLPRPARTSPWWRRGAFAAALLVTGLWLLPALVTDATVGGAGFLPSTHIPVWADEYFAVVNGRTPLVDFVPQYVHLLPLAVEPVLAAFDSSLGSLSVVLAVLSLLALVALYGALHEAVDRRPLAALALYVPLLAFSLFPWTRDGSQWEFNGNYYAFFPGRYLGPFVLCWMCARAVRNRRLPIWLLFFVGGLAILNNAEFGVPCVIALSVALILGSDRRPPLETARVLLPQAVAGLAGALALVCVVILVRSGELPDLGELTYFASLFGRQGFGLVRMPTLGLHIPMYLTFVAAILVAAVRHVQSRPGATLTAMLAYAGVFGLLSGSYFVGRSLPWQLMLLFPIWGFALALLTWTALAQLGSVGAGGRRLSRSLLPSAAALVGFGVMIAAIATFPTPWQQVDRLSASGDLGAGPAEERFVEANTRPGEPILLWGAAPDHRTAERAGVDDVSPWNDAIELLSEREVGRALDALDQAQGSKIFMRPVGPLIADLLGRRGPVAPLLTDAGFRPVSADPESRLELWERTGEP